MTTKPNKPYLEGSIRGQIDPLKYNCCKAKIVHIGGHAPDEFQQEPLQDVALTLAAATEIDSRIALEERTSWTRHPKDLFLFMDATWKKSSFLFEKPWIGHTKDRLGLRYQTLVRIDLENVRATASDLVRVTKDHRGYQCIEESTSSMTEICVYASASTVACPPTSSSLSICVPTTFPAASKKIAATAWTP